MDYPLVRLVSSPDPDATVRCDLNEGTTWPAHDAFSLGAPPLLGDAGGVGADYGYRNLIFNLVIDDSEAQALAKQSELARELLRNENYLLFQLSESAPPVWFRCVRSTPGEMSLATVFRDRAKNRWRVAVSLVADAFALGEVTNAVPDGGGTVTIGNDPALTNGLSLRLANIVGDAPAPLDVALAPGTDGQIQPLISVIPLDAPWVGTVFSQAETWTLVPSASVTASSTASSGSQVTVTLNPRGDVSATRMVRSFVVPYAGRYRLFARTQLNFTGGTPDPVTIAGTGDSVVTSVVTDLFVDRGAQLWRLVELGTYAFPKGNMPGRRPYAIGPGNVGIAVGTTKTGSSFTLRVHIDYVVAVPADLPLDQWAPATLLEFTRPEQTAGDVTLLLNAEDETVEELSAGQHLAAAPEVPHGSFLAVVPGADNGLVFLPRRWRTTTNYDDRLTESNTLTLTYRPRWLYLAGD